MEQEAVLWVTAATFLGAAGIAVLLHRRGARAPDSRMLAMASAAAASAALNAREQARQGDRIRDCVLSAIDLAAGPEPPGRYPPAGRPVRLARVPPAAG